MKDTRPTIAPAPEFRARHPRALRLPRAFSLLEVMIVVALVALLATITVLVGTGVMERGKADQCRQILSVLDSSLTEYEAEKGAMPLYTGDKIHREDPKINYNPPSGFTEGGDERPEVAVYLAQAIGLPGVNNQLSTIDPGLLAPRSEIYEDLAGSEEFAGELRPLPQGLVDDRPSLRDPWGMEILYVHPSNEDAVKAYGRPLNRRPYFMSAGPDFHYDTVEDNIYSYEGVEKPAAGN